MEFTDAEIPQEETQSSEKNDGDPKIVVELGYHGGVFGLGGDVDYTDINNPDLSSHMWNGEVADRLAESQPKVLSIDSIGKSSLKNGDYDALDKRRIWSWLPASPKDINSSGQIYVVTGDTSYHNLGEAYWDFLNVPEPRNDANSNETAQNNRLKQFASNFWSKSRQENQAVKFDAVKDSVVGVSAALLLSEVVRRAVNADEIDGAEEVLEENNLQTKIQRQRDMSRRNFLKWGARVVAGGAVAYHGARAGALSLTPLAPNDELQDIGKYILEQTSQTMPESVWKEGRSALIEAHCITAVNAVKEIEEEENGPDSPEVTGAVVMGNAHGFEANELSRSREARQEAIYKYVKTLQEFLDDTLGKYPDIPRDLAHTILLDMVCRPQLISITDPGVATTNEPVKVINDNVKFKKELESEEVVEAVQNLRRDQYVF